MSLYAKKEGIVAARPFDEQTDNKLVKPGVVPVIGDMVVWDPKSELETQRIMSLGEFEASYIALHHADDDRPRSPEVAQKLAKERQDERDRLAKAKAEQDAKPEVQAAKGPASPSGDSRPMTDLAAAQAEAERKRQAGAAAPHVGAGSGGAPATGTGQGAQDSDQVKGEKK